MCRYPAAYEGAKIGSRRLVIIIARRVKATHRFPCARPRPKPGEGTDAFCPHMDQDGKNTLDITNKTLDRNRKACTEYITKKYPKMIADIQKSSRWRHGLDRHMRGDAGWMMDPKDASPIRLTASQPAGR